MFLRAGAPTAPEFSYCARTLEKPAVSQLYFGLLGTLVTHFRASVSTSAKTKIMIVGSFKKMLEDFSCIA